MGHKNRNYTNYAKPQTEVAVEPEVDVLAEEKIEELAVEPEVVPEPQSVVGVVTDCAKLNVRKAPSTDAEIVCVLMINTEVMVDKNESTDDFYKICTGAGVEGFCMKKFINIEV